MNNNELCSNKKESFEIFIRIFYIAFCLISTLLFILSDKPRNWIMCLLFILFVPFEYFVKYYFKFELNIFEKVGYYFLLVGTLLGACYDLYAIVSYFDLILHFISGILFASIGFKIMKIFLKESKSKKNFYMCLFFAFVFSMAIASIWEVFEYVLSFFGIDTAEDSIIYKFNSYYLSGNHYDVIKIDNIKSTHIYYGDGEKFVIQGYLDLGLLDTLHDIIICMFGGLIFLIGKSKSFKRV